MKGDTGYLWQELWNKYEDADAAQRATLVTALGCIDHRDTLKEFLQKSLDGDVRRQDAYTVFTSVAANPKGAEVALDFLTFWGYEKLEQWYGVVRNAMTTVISGLSNRLTTQAQKDQLEVAVEPYKSRHQGHLKTVQSNIEWLRDHQLPVLENLEEAQEYKWSSGGPAPAAAASALLLLAAATLALLR
ncbi:Membrane alanyl aminopeptidase [Gryllus bimaculatus]|nr:Membrane alanyl aminopeptidase [Gryllus bimaculatus]